MTMCFWLRLRWLLRLWVLLVATTSAPPAIFAYDAEKQATVAYDSSCESVVGYDAVSVLARGEKENGAAGNRVPFSKFAKFLAAEETQTAQTLFHYTNEKGLSGILDSGELNPPLKALNPNDVRYGNGQYLSDIVPGTKTSAQLSREFLGQPFQGAKYTHYLEIDVSDLNVIQGRPGVFVIPGETSLDLTGRIISSGKVP